MFQSIVNGVPVLDALDRHVRCWSFDNWGPLSHTEDNVLDPHYSSIRSTLDNVNLRLLWTGGDTEDRGMQVSMVLEHDYIPHTSKCFFRSYVLLDWSTEILSVNKTYTHLTSLSPLSFPTTGVSFHFPSEDIFLFYYWLMKREWKRRLTYVCRCDERLKANTQGAMYIVVYYESIKRKLKRRLIYEYRCDERLELKMRNPPRLHFLHLFFLFSTFSFNSPSGLGPWDLEKEVNIFECVDASGREGKPPWLQMATWRGSLKSSASA
jgi:hypothetical protein